MDIHPSRRDLLRPVFAMVIDDMVVANFPPDREDLALQEAEHAAQVAGRPATLYGVDIRLSPPPSPGTLVDAERLHWAEVVTFARTE